MNKSELVDVVAGDVELSKTKVAEVINSALDAMSTALKSGDSITFVGFGSFNVVKRAARTGSNPRTGKPLKIKAKKAVRFKTGKALKVLVNKK